MNLVSFIANLAIAITSIPTRIALHYASRHPKQTSAMTLRRILKENAGTAFGRDHHFTKLLWARNADQLFRIYEHAVDGADYEALRPYVERHMQGEPDVLIPGKPLMYATTSGTTAKPKYLPMSAKYLRTVYSRMSKVWMYNMYQHRHKCN